jgi:cytochrome c oxidase subunit 2
MEIHRFEKVWVACALLLIVGFIATITYGAVGAGVAMVNDEGGTVDAQNLQDTEFADPGVRQVGANEYEVYVVAQQFIFRPGTNEDIVLPANSEVTFYITSADVVHGFNIVGTNVNSMAIPGQVAKLTVQFDEPREYGIVCHEYCGAAHHEMAGIVRVVPESEFSMDDTAASDTTAEEDGGEA